MNEFPERPSRPQCACVCVCDYVPECRREEQKQSLLTNAAHVWASCVQAGIRSI